MIQRRKSITIAILSSGLLGLSSFADVMKTEDQTIKRLFPEEPGFKNDTEYKKKFEEMKEKLEQLQETSQNAQNTLKFASKTQEVQTQGTIEKAHHIDKNMESFFPKGSEKFPISKSSPSIPKLKRHRSKTWHQNQNFIPASDVQIFNVSTQAREDADHTMTVLPAGSFVRARVVSGVEAVENEPYPVLLQLEYAFNGPNKSKIDLSNCFMIAKAKANLSTERVIMDTETLSCVKENGEHYKVAAHAYTAGEDSSFGSTGTYISKQGQVLLAAILANIAKNAGEAVAAAQNSTQVVAGSTGAPASATNVTGSQAAFVAGKSVIDAGSLIANWYLEQAKKLVPSIGIGSGQTVHVIMLDTIRVPTLHGGDDS